jgi:hypothetical protein
MDGSPKNLRISWKFFEASMHDWATYNLSSNREFRVDQVYFDHFNIRVSAVRSVDWARVLSHDNQAFPWLS